MNDLIGSEREVAGDGQGFRAVGLLDRPGIRIGFVFDHIVAEHVCVPGRGEPVREYGIGVVEVHLVAHLVAEAVKDRDVG